MESINKYIGIPYKFNGTSFDGVDCLGLCRLFYREHGWIEIDDGLPIDKDWMKNAARRIVRWFGANFEKTRNPDDMSFGDICIFLINGELHFGIYLEYGKLLSTHITDSYKNSYSTIYHRDWWKPFFKVAYKRK